MTDDAESALEVLRGLPDFRRRRLILRIESEGSEVTEWHYRASYPELRDFSVSGPDVLGVILELETKLKHSLSGEQA